MNTKLKITLAVVLLYLFGLIGGLSHAFAATNYQLCKTGTQCTVGEYLYDDNYSPITNATCALTSRHPDGSLFKNSQALTAAAENDGWYSYAFDTTGQVDGLYRSQICCDTTDGQHLCLDKTFQIGPQLSTSDVSSAVWDEQAGSHNTANSFGGNLQQKAPSANDNANAVWSFSGDRTLTSFGDLVSQIWSYTTGSLGSLGSLVSDTWTALNTGVLGNGQQIATKTNVDLATSAATLSIKGSSNKDLTQINDSISTAQASLDSISGKVDTLNTKIDTINTNTSTILTKWGAYTMSDVVGYVDGLESSLGTNSDTCSTTTVFGGIKCIKDKWGTQTADSLYTAANNAYQTASDVKSELTYNGKTTKAYEDIQTIKDYVNTINSSVGSSGDLSSAATIFGKIQGTKETLSSQVTGVQTTVTSIEGKVDSLNTKIDNINTNTTTALSKWGTYSMADVVTYSTNLQTSLGSISNTCSDSTVFGGIKCIKDKWGTQTADILYTTANNAYQTSLDLKSELTYSGKTTKAYEDIQAIENYVTSLDTHVGQPSDLSSAATIFGKIQGTKEAVAGVSTQVLGVQTAVDSISSKIDLLSTKVDGVDTKASALLSKWGSYSVSDVITSLTSITSSLGANSNTCSDSTVFGGIKCLKDKWGSQTADAIYTSAGNAESAATALRAELNYNGKSTTAYQDLQTLITNITAVQNLIGTTNDASTVASLYGKLAKVQSTIANLDASGAGLSDLLGKWGSYSAADLYNKISGISTSVSTNNSIPDVSSILTITRNNATDLQSLKNSVLALQALTLANKALLGNGTAQPIIQTWLEQGSIIFKTLITNPSDITQTIPLKFYLPKEATKADIEKIDDGLIVGYDPTQDAYYVSGSITLGPSRTHIYSVEVTDIWKISAQQIASIKIQAQQLYAPLKGTSYFAQGATLYADIVASLDDAVNTQNQAQTPDNKIKAYRAALIDVNKAKSEVGDLKTLDTSASSAGNLLGSVGGVQTTAVWGLVLVLTAGFVFLVIYMRMLMVQAKPGREEKVGLFKELFMQMKADLKKLREKFNIKTVSFTGAAVCSLLAIFLLGKILLPISPNKIKINQARSISNVATKTIADINTKAINVKDKKEVLGTAVVNKNQVMILVGNNSTGINIRQGPSILTAILTSVKTNKIVTKINTLSGWTEIEMNSSSSKSATIKGWIKDDFIGSIEK